MLHRFLLAALVLSSFAFSTVSHAQTSEEDNEHIVPASDNRPVPWPWAMAQPFPWTDIQGLWKVEQGDFTSYFALKVVRQKSTGVRQLQVKQFDGDTCKVISTGVGIERNQRVLAQMTSRAGTTYRVQLTAFNEKDVSVTPVKGTIPTQGVMVLSLGQFENNKGPVEMVHMQIMKISALLTQRVCIEDVKK